MHFKRGAVLACGALVAVSAQEPLVTPQQIARAEARALEHLSSRSRELGIEPGDLTVARSDVDSSALIHIRLRQTFRGVPVFGGEAIVHFRRDGELFGQTNGLVPNVRLDTRPKLTVDAAVARALADTGCSDCPTEKPTDLWVLRHEGVDRLAYRVRLRRDTGGVISLPVVFVDAHDGRIVWRYDDLQTGNR
jgi:Zn-dependent metalloprotease